MPWIRTNLEVLVCMCVGAGVRVGVVALSGGSRRTSDAGRGVNDLIELIGNYADFEQTPGAVCTIMSKRTSLSYFYSTVRLAKSIACNIFIGNAVLAGAVSDFPRTGKNGFTK